MDAQFTTLGAIIGLVIAIVLIIKKVQPAYSLIFGALIGGLIGGGGLDVTVSTMVSGAGSMMSSVLRTRRDLPKKSPRPLSRNSVRNAPWQPLPRRP